MKHHREGIDETIDRVAAHLTMAPADPDLASRITRQLDRESPFGWSRLAIASAAVAAIVVAAVFFTNAPEVPSADMARVAPPAPSSAVAAPSAVAPDTDSTSLTSAAVTTAPRTAAAEAGLGVEPLPEMQQIESLPPPAMLAVDMLSTDTLTIESVDLAPLDVADLAVRDIDERDSPKE